MDRLLPRYNRNGPPDDNRHWTILVLDSVTQLGMGVSGLTVGSLEAAVVTSVDGSGNPITGGSEETSTIYNGITPLTPLFTPVAAASNGDNTIISATGGKRIRVLSGAIVASGSVNVKFTDGAGGSGITGTMNFVSNSGVQIPFAPVGNFQTSSGNALVLNLSGATNVGGWLTYLLV